MAPKKRAANGPVTLYTGRGTQVTVPAEVADKLKAMGFMTTPAAAGDKDSTESETTQE